MSAAVQLLLAVHGMSISSLPEGISVISKVDCVSSCYWNTSCSSVFFDTSTNMCYMDETVYLEKDLDITSVDMKYLALTPVGCRVNYTWRRDLRLCYKVYNLGKKWTEAENQCVHDGGHLIKVDNAEINAFMNELTISMDCTLWTGGSDKKVEGTYVWADNSPLQTTFWSSGQPNTQSGADCLSVHNVGGGKKWRMNFCSLLKSFVCQLTVGQQIVTC